MAEALPPEAITNLETIAGLAIRLVDVLNSPNFQADQAYEEKGRFAPEVFWRTDRWGGWSPSYAM